MSVTRVNRALWLTLTMLLSLPAVSAVTPCKGGFADIYPCENVDLLAFMSLAEMGGSQDTKGANVWGWADPDDGSEYLIVGLTDAAAFVNVTDPENPIYLGRLASHTGVSSKYRDVKVYRNYAFIVSDLPSLHGMQVFDLHQLRDVPAPPMEFTETAYFNDGEDGRPELGDTHNFYINGDSGFAYLVRTTTPLNCSGAMYMVDINDPLNPSYAGCFEDGGLASDVICVNYHGDDPDYQGREVCVLASDDEIIVADVTDKSAPQTLATVTYPDITRAHNAWLTPDHNFFVSVDMNDELDTGDNTRIFAWDFRDVDAPQLLGIYNGPTAASDHNIWVRGNEAFVGNFRAGVRILDLADIANGNLSQKAFFDMIPEDDNPGHLGGAWAVYAFAPSEVIAAVDKETGLYLLRRSDEPAAVAAFNFNFLMNDGSSGNGSYTLLNNSTFADGAGGTGQWNVQSTPAPAKLVLQYDPGVACAARSIGLLGQPGSLRGPRTCQDGSGVAGFWFAVPPSSAGAR